ncbi:MAG: helix-turn-helix domain-containing protein [Veillonellaceae bacterium]|nr:helix-turn-helix domain-containing protein [Veillonellaceae bacterium]
MATVGEELRRERQRRGITLQDAANALHIRINYLSALESDQYKEIKASLFCKGFIRNYAQYLGLDANRLVANYENVVGDHVSISIKRYIGKSPRETKEALEQHKKVQEKKEELTRRGRRERRRQTANQERVFLGILLIIIVLFFCWLFLV